MKKPQKKEHKKPKGGQPKREPRVEPPKKPERFGLKCDGGWPFKGKD
jgi:hypothetical protein